MPRRILRIYVLCAAALLLLLVTSVASACPSVCECKWKGGKQTVECRNRGLITLPSNIDPETQVLDLSGSNLQTLPREAFMRANLLNLQKIYLGNCRIGQIDPTALRGLTNLIELDLGNNMLTDVPSLAFRDVVSLRELRLNDNPIQKIDDRAFDFVPGLTKLDLSDCRIQNIADRAFQGLDQLSHLRLGGNQLTEVKPQVIGTLTRLHGVELHGNPWVCDCRLRYVRQWLEQHNIPSPVAATCAAPPRLHNRPLNQLDADDFACPPQMSSAHPRRVRAVNAANATISCTVTAVPEAEITWLWQGEPLDNSSSPSMADADDPDSGAGVQAPVPGARIVIIEQGKYDKTSHLMLYAVDESDAGQYVCVATNSAGLAHMNLTLDVDMQSPVAGGLDGAQMAGLGAGVVILLATVTALLLLAVLRRRDSPPKNNEKATVPTSLHVTQQSPGGSSDQIKSPSLSALEYGQVTFVNPNTPGGVTTTVLNKPDLIHDARRTSPANDLNGTAFYQHQQHQQHQITQPAPDQLNILNGEYQSAQSDSFYPSALWDHVNGAVPELHQLSESPGSGTLTLPHVPANGGLVPQPIVNYGDSDAESAHSVSMDSYSLPCRIPQQNPQDLYSSVPFVPYPADYGLPRTQSPCPTVTLSRAAVPVPVPVTTILHDQSQTPSYAGSKASINHWSPTPVSVESSPASTTSNAKSPRFWHRPLMSSGKRNFARDSPDEGYQEECATDV